MEFKQFVLLLVVVLCGVGRIDAFASGTPPFQCATMIPLHGVAAQTSFAPYTITTDSQSYMTGQTTISK